MRTLGLVLGGLSSWMGVIVASRLALLAPMSDELVERIRGQISDLDWQIELIMLAEEDRNRNRPWILLKKHPRHKEFDAAAWVETSTETADRLSVYDLKTGHLFVRSLPVDSTDPHHQRSANYETLALLLRSQIKAMQSSPQETASPPPAPPPPPSALETPPALWQWSAQVAGRQAFTGFAARGTPGLRLQAGLESVNWAFALGLSAALPQSDVDAQSSLRLNQYGMQISADRKWAHFASSTLALVFMLGLEGYWTRLSTARATLVPTDPKPLWSGRNGLALAWDYYPSNNWNYLCFRFAAGADLIWSAPEYSYANETKTELRNRLWTVQPLLSFGLKFHKKRPDNDPLLGFAASDKSEAGF